MPRTKTVNILDGLRELGYTDTQILEHILFNIMSGTESEYALKGAQLEFAPETIDEDGFNWLEKQ